MSQPKKPAKKRLGKGLSAMLDSSAKALSTPSAPSVRVGAAPGVATRKTASPNEDPIHSDGLSDQVGRGVELSQAVDGKEFISHLPIASIHAGRHQPRTHFDEAALDSLAASIRSVGVIQPITVRKDPDGGYELIAGERRWRASKLAGLDEIPAQIVEMDEQSAAETALIENLQREDLNPIERAEAIGWLIDRFGFSQSAVAERVGLDRSSVSNLLRLMDLEEPVRALLAGGLLGLGHGKALLAFPAGDARVDAAARASREAWSVRRLEDESRRLKRGAAGVKDTGGTLSESGGDVETRALEKRLGEHLGTRVTLRVDRAGKGTVQIRFFDLDHFDDLMSRIGFDSAGGVEC